MAAQEQATKSDHEFRHGAVLARGARILQTACNKRGCCAFGQRFRERGLGYATLHAELAVVLGMPRKQTKGATVYVVRINKTGKLVCSIPCSMCQAVMQHCGIAKIICSIGNNKFARI